MNITLVPKLSEEVKMRGCSLRYLRNIVCVMAVWAMAQTGHTQTIPGHWHKVVLPQPNGLNDNTVDFDFIDSLHGICLSSQGAISSTSNGGRSWTLDTNLNTMYIYKYNLKSLECTAPHHGFLHGQGVTLSISPGCTSLFSIPQNGEVNYGDYFTLAERMYDTAYGFRLVEYMNGGQFDDSVMIIVTHDGWQHSAMYGSAYIFSPDSTVQQLTSPALLMGCIIDSNELWFEQGRLFKPDQHGMVHTSNGGTNWQTYDAIGTKSQETRIEDVIVNANTREVFCMGNWGAVDYAYSNDYGASWHLDSTFGIHLYRMANPAPGTLWAMIGQSGSGWTGEDVLIYPPADVQGGPNDYSRKIGYSSDNGRTWCIDSMTFVGDSLEEMHFLDARHGWIASWSHDSVFMWYYSADNASVEEEASSVPEAVSIYPNPVANTLITARFSKSSVCRRLQMFDDLGIPRKSISVAPDQGEAEIDVSTLPNGCYTLALDGRRSRFAVIH